MEKIWWIIAKLPIFTGLIYPFYLLFSYLYRDIFMTSKVCKEKWIKREKIWFYNLFFPAMIYTILLFVFYYDSSFEKTFDFLMSLSGYYEEEIFAFFVPIGFLIVYLVYYLVYMVCNCFLSNKYLNPLFLSSIIFYIVIFFVFTAMSLSGSEKKQEPFIQTKEECLENIKHLDLPIVTQLELCDKDFDPNLGMLVAGTGENDSNNKE